ncbi:aspartyl aminopeptidase, putative [Eimeria maxima]|uniref:aspartyl aminopeptidase n=1 Tax=Eimeria maxima TaxID=5804 RepID=U6M6L3_EIMMA|nr:aspartyl aminopeptidase, putative [Eimeria maxima]CDJ59872.1 aspartyl aminopeptidase, putative [Eimeria maxima]
MALELARPVAERFIHFVNKTGSPYHSVKAVKDILITAGFSELDERGSWKVTQGGKYFVTRNDSCIAAFVVGAAFGYSGTGGFCITATHTDSPCLRLRPRAFAEKEGYHMGGVECYGGGLWHTWFDRGLGMAGKVALRVGNKVEERLLHISKPLFYLPNLAIHLKTAEEIGAFTINKEQHLQPVLCSAIAEQLSQGNEGKEQDNKDEAQRLPPALERLVTEAIGVPKAKLLDWDFCLMDSTPSRLSGIHSEFIESPRLDNLASTFAAFEALIETSRRHCESIKDDIIMAVAFDHEEVGLIYLHAAAWLICWLLQGVVIKENANQSYASNACSMSFVRVIAEDAGIPLQDFVVRNDSRCGGTVGAMLSARLGVRTVDIGIPQWAMHSCREICGVTDLMHLQKLIEVSRPLVT